MATRFNRRPFISLMLVVFFTTLLVSSLLLFLKAHTPRVATLHTGIGFIFIIALGWHLSHNFASLKQYVKWKGRAPRNLFFWGLPWVLSLGLMLLAVLQTPPFAALYEWGNRLREGQASEQSLRFSYIQTEHTAAGAVGNRLRIDLRKGPYFHWPQYALWLETLDGEFIQPLYVTQKLALGHFDNKVTLLQPGQVINSDLSEDDSATWDRLFRLEFSPETAQQRPRPESLPVFLHKSAQFKGDAAYKAEPQSTASTASIDAYAGATLLDNFLLNTRSQNALPEQFKVRFEINQSFDFNAFYSSDRFPDDPVYSGNGFSGQPSVIYEAIIDGRNPQGYYPMTLIGHGHHSGANGEIYPDIQALTTAKKLIDRIIVETNPMP